MYFNEKQKELILKSMKGFDKVNQIVDDEIREQLSQMTESESRLIYDSLCSKQGRY